MTSAVKSGTSDQPFNRLLPGNVLSKVKIPEIIGCCSNLFKFSYVISAPLHTKGFWEFWAKEKSYGWADRLAVTFDLLIHLALWFIPLTLEIWGTAIDHRSPNQLAEFQSASLWALIAAVIGIAVAQLFAMTAGGQDAGRLYPTTYGAIVGGAYASIVFSVLWLALWMMHIEMLAHSEKDGDHELDRLRHSMMWSTALKFIAVTTLAKNASFWGPCTTDVVKENNEQTMQVMKDQGLNSDGTMSASMA